MIGTYECTAVFPGELVTRRVDELRAHPSYVRHRIAIDVSKLSALAQLGESAFQEPIAIARDNTILDGYARWELARRLGRGTLSCIEYGVNEAEALHFLLQRHHGSAGLRPFSRILLATDLEPWLQEKARANQQAGGRNKGSSKLTEAERLDVRSEIAAAAGVSVGNVSKVKQLTLNGPSELLQALRNGEISIHRAWTWSKEPADKQREKLWIYQSQRGIKKTVRSLILRHRRKEPQTVPSLGDLIKGLSALESSGEFGAIRVQAITSTGMTVFISEELFRALGFRKELTLTCA
jgi:hypothetical protein